MNIAVAGSTGLIGSQLKSLAENAGHEVTGLSREAGIDLLKPDGLAEMLEGIDVVVDVTQSPTLEEKEASAFFETVAKNLGQAATAAGVGRTLVLSIVGADKSPDYGYYVAKVVQEETTRAAAPNPVVLRATQFHEFAGQMLDWNREGDTSSIIDVPLQPVASREIAQLLLELATAEKVVDTELAGPQAERLPDLSERVAARRDDEIVVKAVPGPESMAGGSMLPDSSAVIRGPRWQDWFEEN